MLVHPSPILMGWRTPLWGILDLPPLLINDHATRITKIKFIEFLPPANVVCEGYVFTGVCLSTGGVGIPRTPPVDGPPGMETPPDGDTPGWRSPRDGEPPGIETPPGEPPRSMCGRYTSYWNAFLFILANIFSYII